MITIIDQHDEKVTNITHRHAIINALDRDETSIQSGIFLYHIQRIARKDRHTTIYVRAEEKCR